jgi:prolycopene isomerase
MAEKYDAIVVGAGPGGITCGALLAQRGLKTIVLDKNSQVGGKTMTLSKNGFRYEYYPIWPCPGADSQIHAVLKALEIEDQVELIQPDPLGLMHYEDQSGEIRNMIMRGPGHPMDPQELFKLLGVKDNESEEVLRMFGEVVLMAPQDQDLLDDVSILEFLDRYNIPKSVRAFFATLQSEGTLEVPGDIACASEVVKTFQQLVTGGSGCYPAGGLSSVYEAIAGAAKANGCDIQLETRVEQIVVQDGRVNGVHTERGDFDAPIVISNAGIQPTVIKLVGEEHFDKGYVNYVRDLVPSLGFAGARYIVSKPVLEYPIYIYFSDNTISTTDHIIKEVSGQMPDQIYVFVSTTSLFPGMAPPGKQLVYTGISCPADPKINPKPWIDKVEAEVSRIWPAVMENIEEREYYGSAHISALSRDPVVPGTGGECIGLGQIVGQCGKYKPSAKAPLSGLFYVGADAGSTGFFANNLAVASGINVARKVIQYFKTHSAMGI